MSKRISNVVIQNFGNKKARLNVQVSTNTNLPLISAKTTTSTSSNYEPPPEKEIDMWGDDADDDFVLLASQIAQDMESNAQNKNLNDTDINFDKFSREVQSSTQLNPKIVPRYTGESFLPPPGPSSSSHRSPGEIQIDYLQSELSKFRKEIATLRRDYGQAIEKFHMKEGEVSTLRHQMDQLKKTQPKLQVDKLREAEQARDALQAQVREQERLIRTMQMESTTKMEHSKTYLQHNQFQKPEIYNLNLPTMEMAEKLLANGLEVKIFEADPIKNTDPDTKISELIIDLQNVILSVMKHQTPDLEDVQMIAVKGILYLQRTSLDIEVEDPDTKWDPMTEAHSVTELAMTEPDMKAESNLCQIEKIFPDEISPAGRRFLAMVAHVALHLPILDILVNEVFISRDEDDDSIEEKISFFGILCEILYDIGFAKNLGNFYGFVSGASLLLENLADQISEKEEHLILAKDLFKRIVFTRPNNVILLHLSKFLLKMSTKESALTFLQSLCHKSPKETFVADESFKIQRFTEQSCILQVYCSLLEATCLERTLPRIEGYHDSLVKITQNTLVFFMSCFTNHSQWTTSLRESKNCKCYNRIGSCVIILTHFCVNLGIDLERKKKDAAIISIVREAVLLISFFLKANGNYNFLENADYRMETRLQVLHSYIRNHQKSFKFDKSHDVAFNSWDLQQITTNQLYTQIQPGLLGRESTVKLDRNFFY